MKKNIFPRKILLLSSVPPCSNYSGGLALQQLCRFLPKGNIVNFVIINKKLIPKIPPDLKWLPTQYSERPYEGWSNLPFLSLILSLVGETYIKIFVIRKISKDIIEFGKKHQVNCLWVILEGQTLIRLALPIAKKLKIPLITQIWDPPEWPLRDQHVDQLSKWLILKQFKVTLRQSWICATTSFPMAEQYARDFQTKTTPFLPSLDPKLAFPSAVKINSQKELIIAVAGQLYSKKEWNTLIKALDNIHWQFGKRQVKIRLLGNWFKLEDIYSQVNIEYLGWRTQEETVKIMSQSDILYCPYWFDKAYEKEAQLSFPSKLTTYLASGRPVFFHGPKYSAPGKFLEKNQAALLCSTLEIKKMIKMLKRLVADQKYYARLAKNGRQAFDKYLTSQTLHQNFAEFLGVEEKELIKL